jgi:phosphoglycerol transferase MdoB-like AlkP superfamily enzyme
VLFLFPLIQSILLLLQLTCLLFFCFNYSNFSDIGFWRFLSAIFFGIRFDVSVIILLNSVFILLYLLPAPFREKRFYRIILAVLFVSINSVAVLTNCVDLAYFQFTFKRTNASVFNFFTGKIGNDFGQLVPVFLKDYWYIIVIWAAITYGMYYYYKKIEKNNPLDWNLKQYGIQVLIFIVVSALAIVGYRGGLQLKPISIVSAGEYVSAKYVPLVINTPFAIIKTLDVKAIEPSPNWKIDERKLKSIYNPYHKDKNVRFRRLNVMVIALESFSKEYIGALNGRGEGYTPFLDSLIGESLTFNNAYSNGKTSIEGIPSIVAGIPTWMNEPYITSPYGSNQINSMANLLKPLGYYTAFFHGGTNGTMGFDAFANLAGYDDYFGRSEYHNEKDYDGNWGIWDEEFLQYTANTLNKKKQPFFATLFTLTSHHPYAVPDKYKNKFKEGPLPIEKSIGYTDFALRRFFETAKKMPWFKNTLFVLAADHTGISTDIFYTSKVGNCMIPIIYYMPRSYLKGIDTMLTQQIDIMPSVLDYLNYPSPYFSFGVSVFEPKAQHFSMIYNSGIFQLIENNYVMQFDGEKAIDLYHFPTDSLLYHDLLATDTTVAKKMEDKTKAIIQTYQQSLMNNKMHFF